MTKNLLTDEAELLNALDKLKGLSIGPQLELPQLVIVGDQSSGKSSVLEAISNVHFPAEDGLCTKHPTELVLRTGDFFSQITIRPDPHPPLDEQPRPPSELSELSKFVVQDPDVENLKSVYTAAQKVMGIGTDKNFSRDILRIELTDHGLPNLTLIDLPGLFSGRGPNQSEGDAQIVSDMVANYVQQDRTAILMVVSSRVDIAAQIVTKRVHIADPKGKRTIGLLTKPDVLDETPKSAHDYVRLVRNEVIPLELGWYVVKNRSQLQLDQNISLQQRHDLEATFLQRGRWADVEANRKGIDSLKAGLEQILLKVVLAAMPALITEAEAALVDLRKSHSEPDPEEVARLTRDTLIDIGAVFPARVMATLNNTYGQLQGYGGVLLKRIERLTKELATRLRGDCRLPSGISTLQHIHKAPASPQVSSFDTKAEIAQLMHQYPGNPGQFNALLVSKVFYVKTAAWPALLKQFVVDVADSMEECAKMVLYDCLQQRDSAEMLDNLSTMVISPGVERVRMALQASVDTSVSGHEQQEIIDFADEIQQALPSTRSTELLNICREALISVQQLTTPIPTDVWNRVMDDLARRLENIDQLTIAEMVSCFDLYYENEVTRVIAKLDTKAVLTEVRNTAKNLWDARAVNSLKTKDLCALSGLSSDAPKDLDESVKEKITAIEQALSIMRKICAEAPTERSGPDPFSESDGPSNPLSGGKRSGSPNTAELLLGHKKPRHHHS